MSRTVKRILLLVGCLLLVPILWVGWQLFRIEAMFCTVTWQTTEGGLTLIYVPAKETAIIYVGSDYKNGGTLTWEMTDPGTTKLPIGAPIVPAPEILFARAAIGKPDLQLRGDPQPDPKSGLESSSARGLSSLYADGLEENIMHTLEYACSANELFCGALHDVQRLAEMASMIQYIDDSTQFKHDGDIALTAEESKAIMVAKRHLERQFAKPLQASFTVSSAAWGYQVNFANARCMVYAGNKWVSVPEGFGEVFLSKEHFVLRSDIGS